MTSRGAEKMNNDTIGVDVSKDHLDAHRLAEGAARRFANDRGGHKALIKWLAQTPRYRVVFEPTGPYHRAVERALGIAGVPFVKVNPRQARRFAEATGKLAKTDRLDAAILARMGALLELQARPATSEILLELKELYVARACSHPGQTHDIRSTAVNRRAPEFKQEPCRMTHPREVCNFGRPLRRPMAADRHWR